MDTPEQEQPNQLNNQDVSRIFQEAQAKEAEAYELFSQRFQREFPMPEKAAVKLMNSIGWQFISIIIQSVFAIVLAALRTADMFFDAAAGTNLTVQWMEAVSAIGAIELGIVIFATIKSEAENRKTQIADLKAALNIDVRLLRTGIIACVAISIIAGLGVSFKGFGIAWEGFNWIVAIVMGIGASLVAWVSGDILGAMLARWNNAISLANVLYAEDLEKREEKKRAMWEAAPERMIARSQLVELKEFQAATRYRAERAPRAKAAPAPAPAPKQKTGTRSNEIRMRIYEHLDKVSFEEQRIAGPSELARDLGVAKSYASGVVKDWTAEHQADLIARGILASETPEEVDGEA